MRNITIAATGVKEQALKVGATLWPSHAHVKVAKGDVVFVEGKFTRTKGENKEGETVTYSNLSVTRIAVLGKVDAGKKDAEATSSSAPADDADDDDEIPF